MREHNAICEHLHAQHPELDDQDLYDKARLVNSALMAKIHTVDWTPAIIAHPTTVLAHARQLVGPRGRAARQAGRPAHVQRRRARHPRLGDRPPRRAVLADRGVRRRLPHAPADPRRLQLPLARRRPRAPRRDAARPRSPAGSRDALRAVDARPPLLVRDDAPRRDHAPQLPEVPPALRPARRLADRPRRDRHPALA